ncbi:MAG: tol-pal system-associated acyl-CoA thioesterase [Betaproteobacteria bacterium]|nr:tol-pal system-associated acyl-CoA thioesterase [Betaproteobacteria bacterium]
MTVPGASAARAGFSFKVRVYYEDTDAAGVVYYANYLKFMERARTEWLEALGFPLAAFERDHRVAFVVRHADIDFLLPARLNDRLEVTVEALDHGASRMAIGQRVLRGGTKLATARITLACLDTGRWRPTRIPAPLAAVLKTGAIAARRERRPSRRAAESTESTEQEAL